MRYYEELCVQMMNDPSFDLKSRLEETWNKLSIVKIVKAYNNATAYLNICDMEKISFAHNEEQAYLVNMVFLTTSLARYERAYGKEWVKDHVNHYNKTDSCISMNSAGIINTLESYEDVDFMSQIIKYLVSRPGPLESLEFLALDNLYDNVFEVLKEYGEQQGINMKEVNYFTEEDMLLARALDEAADEREERGW